VAGGKRAPLYAIRVAFGCLGHAARQVRGREAQLRAALVAADSEGCGQLAGAQLEAAFDAAGLRFTRHQLIALRRRADKERGGGAVATEEVLRMLGLGGS
jgi:hypothetical protein